MLSHSELDTKVSDVDIETTEFDNCREISESDRDANGVLVIIQERARFSHKDGWKFIDLFTQSISKLYQMSQLYPRTKGQEESSKVT